MKVFVILAVCLVGVTLGQPLTRGGPLLTSTGTVHRVVEGERAVLPCRVTDLGDFVLLWRRDTRVMFAGEMKVRRDKRLSLAETDLVLDKVEMGDRGDYTCQVETGDESPPMIVHTLEVLQPPKIRSKPDNGLVIVKEGTTPSFLETISLELLMATERRRQARGGPRSVFAFCCALCPHSLAPDSLCGRCAASSPT